jgi:hypothetical protein
MVHRETIAAKFQPAIGEIDELHCFWNIKAGEGI